MMQGKKKIVLWASTVLGAIILIILLVSASKIVETVEKGTYQVKQAAISGTMSARMIPGMWWQMFGDISTWPVGWTFFFTHDEDTTDDVKEDTSIEVRFNDGSKCNISGTLRIQMPRTEDKAIELITVHGYKTHRDVEEKLIKPTVRKVLRSTANLMSARESYSENRPDFITWCIDQIENGLYKTEEEVQQVEDLVTGEKTWKKIKVIRKNPDGTPMYEPNPMQDTGIQLMNFEVKSFRYEEKVDKQIAAQQEARMAVETAKAKAEEAKQEELKAIAEGKMNVAKAKYEKEQEKIKAVVEAQKNKEVQELDALRDKQVAITQGEKRKEVATLDRDAAKLKKEELTLLGEGEARRKQLVLAADGALAQKLETYERVNAMYASAMGAYKGQWVPQTVMGAPDGSSQNGANALLSLFTAKVAKDLALDMSVPKGPQQ